MQGKCLDDIYYASPTVTVPRLQDLGAGSQIRRAERVQINLDEGKTPLAGEF
jgi:hypothetical protein